MPGGIGARCTCFFFVACKSVHNYGLPGCALEMALGARSGPFGAHSDDDMAREPKKSK